MSKMIVNCPHLIYETIVPVEDANQHFPTERSRQTYERWMRFGCRGVILESTTIGFRRYLSVEGMPDFCLVKPVRKPTCVRPASVVRLMAQDV